jgi:hypothetical protein
MIITMQEDIKLNGSPDDRYSLPTLIWENGTYSASKITDEIKIIAAKNAGIESIKAKVRMLSPYTT